MVQFASHREEIMAGTANVHSIREAKELIAKHCVVPMTIKSEEGEYRVAYKNDPKAEDSAYYTGDLTDAVGTAIKMAEWKQKNVAERAP